MKIAIASLYDDNYEDFVQQTLFSNHIEYCNRHGYTLLAEKRSFVENKGWEQIKFLLENISKYDWIWYVGNDTLVMNHTIKVEDKIDNNYHYIVSSDINGPNAHSFLVRNSPECIQWLEFIWSMRFNDDYFHHNWADNQVVHDFHNQQPWSTYIKVQPQRYMNSYLYRELWGYRWEERWAEGQFEEGDWLLHMPGTDLETRKWIVENFKNKVIK